MPTYEYACERCEREFEVEQRITDDPIKTCPHCRSRRVKRLISRTSFVLKGGGWYSDLYSSPGAKPSADGKGEAKEKPKDSDGGESKPSESKPSSGDKASGKAKSDKAVA